jgi:hypothetical protein
VHDEASYAYLLGCYLGDGNIVHKPPLTWTLRIACDAQYPGIQQTITRAMTAVFEDAHARVRPYTRGAANVVSITDPAIGRAFPQPGPGRSTSARFASNTGKGRSPRHTQEISSEVLSILTGGGG